MLLERPNLINGRLLLHAIQQVLCYERDGVSVGVLGLGFLENSSGRLRGHADYCRLKYQWRIIVNQLCSPFLAPRISSFPKIFG